MENSIRLRRLNNSLMLDLIGDDINTIEFDIHLASIKKLKKFQKLYINIENLNNIDNNIIGMFKKMKAVLKEKHVCFVNVNAINNSILNLFEIDKLFQLYMNKHDAFEGKKPIINRNFKVL